MIMINTPRMLRFVFRRKKRQMILSFLDDDFVPQWGKKTRLLSVLEAKITCSKMLCFQSNYRGR